MNSCKRTFLSASQPEALPIKKYPGLRMAGLLVILAAAVPGGAGGQTTSAVTGVSTPAPEPQTLHEKIQQRADRLLARNLEDLSVLAEQAALHTGEPEFQQQMLDGLVQAYPAGLTALIVQKEGGRVTASGVLAESPDLAAQFKGFLRAAGRSKSDKMLHEFFINDQFLYALVRPVGSRRSRGAAAILFPPAYFFDHVLRPFAADGHHHLIVLNPDAEFVTSNKPTGFRKRLCDRMKDKPAEGGGALTWMDPERFNLFTYRYTWNTCRVLDRTWVLVAGGEESGASQPGADVLTGKWTGAYASPRHHQKEPRGSGQQQMLILQDGDRIEMIIGKTKPPRLFFGEASGFQFKAKSGPQQVVQETLEGSYDPDIRSIKGSLNEFRNGEQVRTAFYMFKVEWGE